MGYVHGIHRRQANLFPAMLDDYIAEDNPVQFVDVFVDSLDLAALDRLLRNKNLVREAHNMLG